MDAKNNNCFTVVFQGDLRAIAGNPFKFVTAWGKPTRIMLGDGLEELDQIKAPQTEEPEQ